MKNLIDLMLNPKFGHREIETTNKAKLLAMFAFLIMLACVFYGKIYWNNNMPYSFLGAALAAFFTLLSVLVLRFSIWLRLASVLLCLGVFLAITMISFATGGLNSPALFWMLVVIVCAAALDGKKFALFAALVTLIPITLLYFLTVQGLDFNSELPSTWKNHFAYVVVMGLVICVLVMIYYYESTHEAALQKLRVANEAAEAANKAKSTFLANMSHELRTPLNAVLGFSEVLSEDEQDEKRRRYLQHITTAGKSLLDLINDILDLSKIEAGKIVLSYKPVKIQNLLQEMLSLHQKSAQDKNLQVYTNFIGRAPEYLLLDESKCRQIITNLLGNAIKFTSSGHIRLECEVQQNNLHDKYTVIFRVSDTGKGIPKDQYQRIFDAFEQVKTQNVHEHGGVGLGLAICDYLTSIMGASIKVESEVGRGSTFIVTIPDVQTSVMEIDSVENPEEQKVRFKPAKIMVIEDISYNMKLLSEYLTSFNFTVIEACNGKQALKLLEKISPDLILADMKMPEMDGYEFSRELKSQDIKIPVVAITASALLQDEKIIREICDDYLRKPISKKDMIHCLMKFLDYSTESPR